MESAASVQDQVKEKYGSAARAVAESGSARSCSLRGKPEILKVRIAFYSIAAAFSGGQE